MFGQFEIFLFSWREFLIQERGKKLIFGFENYADFYEIFFEKFYMIFNSFNEFSSMTF